MSRVISLHETILHHNVNEEEFERFLREEWPSVMAEIKDTKMYVLKGIEGDRKGRYLMMIETESQETYLRNWPERGQPSEGAKQMLEKLKPFIEKWRTFANYGNPTFTSYIEIA